MRDQTIVKDEPLSLLHPKSSLLITGLEVAWQR